MYILAAFFTYILCSLTILYVFVMAVGEYILYFFFLDTGLT
jgi:hypothetical protein